ncbi:MAG: GntR family transcriptional regulator [Anaerolineales bacterium]|jgi:GntR family transcriptional regulator
MSDGLDKPLYIRIQEYIAELILSGKLAPEAKIQSEREFSEDLGVSRMTVRRAITELVHEGLLERKHGSGTYVSKPKITYQAGELANYVEAMRRRNIATASQLLEFDQVAASRRLAEALMIEIGNPVYRVAILRFANRVPVVLERVFISCARLPRLEEWNLEKTSIQDLLTEAYHITLGQISQTVEAVVAADTVAQQLRVPEGFPLLMLSRLIFGSQQDPVVYAQDFLRGDYARIHTDAQLEQKSAPIEASRSGKEKTKASVP